MTWLAWRQHRMQLLFGAAFLALMLAFLLPTGLGIASTYRSSGLASCLSTAGRDCGELSDSFIGRYSRMQFLIPLFLVLPAIVGMFWGAPLVARETEHGTHRLAWTQSVTRSKWLNVKLLALVAATLAGIGSVAWVLSWWSRPLVAASDDRFNPGIFDIRGVVPVAYALFALALGVAAGTLIRRTVPAMAATFTGFGGVRLAVALLLRPHYAAPRSTSFALFGRGVGTGQGDWILSTKTVDAAGRFVTSGEGLDLNYVSRHCPGVNPSPGSFPSKDALTACVRKLGLHVQATYQPGSRYWRFQFIETGIFVALAAGLLLLAAWWVRRRVS